MVKAAPYSFATQKYDFDYFSGSQTQVFFKDIWVDDLMRIQFAVIEKVRPVFGANSRYWDAVIGGQVMVEGRFSINFKEKAYIPIILDYARKDASLSGTPVKTDGTGYTFTGKDVPIPVSIERAKRLWDEGGLNAIKQGEDLLMTSLHWTDDWAFENQAEGLEDLLWGSEAADPNQEQFILDRPLVPIPFDIFIVYGDYTAAAENLVNHTAIKLEDCVIVGESQIIEVGGQPILETYDFIARRKK